MREPPDQDRPISRRAFAESAAIDDQFLAGAITNLDLLTSEQSLVAADPAVAASDGALVQDQITVFKALGGGWQAQSEKR